MPSAADVIRLLDLKPHPEGGHFRETFRDTRTVDGARATLTAI
jgi:predicted cupin superfamily sugar epimerase